MATREKVSGDDCVICLAPDYIANLEMDDYAIRFTTRFNGFYHHLSIPYEAISLVYAYQCATMLEDNGEMNVFTLPKVVLPPGAVRRNEAAADREKLNETLVLNLEDQPAQGSDAVIPTVASFKRQS